MAALFAFEVSVELGAIAVFGFGGIVTITFSAAMIYSKVNALVSWSKKIDKRIEEAEEYLHDHDTRLKIMEYGGRARGS